MRAIRYHERVLALATRRRVFLTPTIERLTAGHPLARMVAVMCLYSRDVDAGEVPGPYTRRAAEFYARCVLVPDEEFVEVEHASDAALAARFAVPVEQIAAKRRDLEP